MVNRLYGHVRNALLVASSVRCGPACLFFHGVSRNCMVCYIARPVCSGMCSGVCDCAFSNLMVGYIVRSVWSGVCVSWCVPVYLFMVRQPASLLVGWVGMVFAHAAPSSKHEPGASLFGILHSPAKRRRVHILAMAKSRIFMCGVLWLCR